MNNALAPVGAGSDIMVTTTPAIWTLQHQVNSIDAGDQSDPVIAKLRLGGYVIVWKDGADLRGQIFGLDGSRSGGRISIDLLLDSDDASKPAIDSTPDGGFITVYQDNNADGTAIRMVTRSHTGALVAGTGTTVQEDTNADVLANPSVGMRDDGSFFVAYNRNHQVVGRLFTPGGATAVEATFSTFARVSGAPDVDIRADGGVVMVHDQVDGSGSDRDIWVALAPRGDRIDSPNDQTDPHVAALTGGGYAVVWSEANGDGSSTGIRASVYDADGLVVRGPFTVNSITMGSQHDADVVGLDDGGFVVIWDDEQFNRIALRRFDAAGMPVGAELTAGANLTEIDPAIARLGDGRFVVGFQETSGDDDIYASIFDPRDGPINGTSGQDGLASTPAGTTVSGFDAEDFLVGHNGNDTLVGGRGWDILVGAEGDDTFVVRPGEGRDLVGDLIAGAHTADRLDLVAFANLHDLADVLARTVQVGTVAEIRFGGDNTVRLQGVQKSDLHTDDILLDYRIVNDFGSDARADILWRHDNGTANVFAMDGARVLGGSNLDTPIGNEWAVADKVDLNGDSHADILWRHSNGTLNAFLMEGAHVIGGSNLTSQPGGDWQVAGTGDFNNDGFGDILLRHSNATLNVFLMRGTTVMGASNISTQPGAGWHVGAVGDFNGDNMADILLRHTNSTLNVYTMDGATVLSGANTSVQPGPFWAVADAGDFDADGKADILLEQKGGMARVLKMNGATVLGGGDISLQPGINWGIEDAGDYNGDGRTDILWRHTNGTANVYTMDGETVRAGSNITLQPGADWHVV